MDALNGLAMDFADGDIVFLEGDAAADMFVVRSGAVDIVRDRDGARELLERVGEGGFFGEVALFSPGPRTATAVASGPTRLEVIDLPTFQAFVGDPLVWMICAKLSERLRRAGASDVSNDQ
jgi:CRP-like cAMP-binding protein